MNKFIIVFALLATLSFTLSSCEDESNNIIVIDDGSPQNEEGPAEEEEEEEEEPNEEETGGENSDTTATDTPIVWDLFSPYACYDDLGSTSFDILTWNIEWFPKREGNTISRLAELIKSTNADLIAIQEVDNNNALNDLIALLPGWNYKLYDVRYDQDIAYLYKESEITSISELSVIYENNSYAFPRQPVITTVTHANGQEITLFNIHLKCCGDPDEIDRRRQASVILKDYIDANLANEKVIVLGDFNDEIADSETPFMNFIADSSNYYFADMEIATGSYQYWSYPDYGQYGSHIDHILISNELFDNATRISTLEYEDCISSYDYYISDHRPLLLSIE